MIRCRRFMGLLASAIVLFSQLHVWKAAECSMCGASCRCTPRASADPCHVRAAGCGGTTDGAAIGSGTAQRGVLADRAAVVPPRLFGSLLPAPAALPPHPIREPLDRPPRVSC